MAQINDIVYTGSGILVTYSDGCSKQFVWRYEDGVYRLTIDGGCPRDDLFDIIRDIKICNCAKSFYSHVFGIGGDHLSAAATDQVGDNLTPNTWTVLSYDKTILESHGACEHPLAVLDGVINVPAGEWNVDATVMAYRIGLAGPDTVTLSIHGYFTDTNEEIPYSFYQDTSPAEGNDAISVRTSFMIDNLNHTDNRTFSIRIQSDTNKCIWGLNPEKYLPVATITLDI